MSRGERKAMMRRDHPALSLSRQCKVLSISRSSFYYAPKGESPENLALMRRIDELFLKYPFYGSRQMVRQLRRDGVCVGRHRVRRLMRLMGLEAIYQAPRTSTPHPTHRIYPYLLKGIEIDRPNQVWCADITYIPVQRGFLYLIAIMDWATRHVLSWRLSNTMDARFCIDALNVGRLRKPRNGFLYLIAIMDWATRHVLSWRLSNTMDATPTRTRAASSPASTSPASSKTPACASPWTVAAAAWTTSSSSGCGGR